MKKLFSLFAAMFAVLALNAAVINISPTSPQPADNLRLALNGAATGDTIVMAAGTYMESPSDYIAFTGKEVTVMAAENAEVILQPQVPIRLKEGAVATFIGIKFDCGHLGDVNSYENLIVPADDTEGKTVILSGCEFYNWKQVAAIIRSTTSRRLSAVTIDKCYFHDVMKSCLFLENENEAAVAITNSTFANVATSDSYSAGVIDIRATAGSLNVNQCTFYNVLAMNTDYAAVGKVKLESGAAVSNCIFAMPTEAASSVRTIRDKVAATNILVYNYTADSKLGMQSNVAKTNCIIGDPLFKDTANGDFTLGEGSPALTMNDGAPIGDPRWVPSVAPAHTYTVAGAPAALFGQEWKESYAENDMEFLANQAYTWIKDSVALRAGTVEFKVVEDHAWTNAWPKENYQLAIPEDGYYSIIIVFNLAADPDSVVEAKAIKVGDIEPIVEHIFFTQACAKDSLAPDAKFGNEIFNVTITDTDNKMEIDANNVFFGADSIGSVYNFRLKTGGKSSSKNFMTINIPEDGLLSIAVRTSNSSDSTRTLVLVQGEDTLYNKVVKESDAVKYKINDSTTVSLYPYVVVPVKAGQVTVTYPVGALNFYAFAFTNQIPEPQHTYTVAGAPASVFGTEWAPANTANDMKEVEAGIYLFLKDSVALPEGEVKFKVVEDHSWDNAWPADNYVLKIDSAGIYHIAIYFNAVTKEIRAAADKIGDAEFGKAKYYVAGSMNGWKADAAYELVANPEQQGEFIGEFAFKANDAFKVIKDNASGSLTWYPDGMGNDYKITQDGTYKIFFRPEGNVEGWYEGFFNVLMKEEPIIPMENPIDTTKFFTGEGWTPDTLSTATWDAENQKVVVDIALPKVAQWQGQLWLKLPMEVKVDKEYDLAFKIKANKTFEGTIVKYQENAEMLIDWNLALTADVETVYEKKNMPGVLAAGGVTGNGVLCIDFGFAPAETHIEIYEIAIVEHEPTVAPAKFYVTGNDAFTVDAGKTTADSWNIKAFRSESDTMTVALKAGAEYQIKVSVDGTWNTAMGYNDLSEKAPGIIDADGNNHNIGFSLVEDGNVQIIYTGEVFKLIGNFVTEGIDNTAVDAKAVKSLENGILVIRKNGKAYTVTGLEIK